MENGYLLKGIGQTEPPPEPRVPREASRGRQCLVMLACFYLQAVVVGSMTSMGVMYAELIAVFETTRSFAAMPESLYVGLATGGGVFVSPFVKRYGPGPSVMVGAVFGVLGLSVNFAFNNIIALIVTVGVVAGMGLCVSYLASSVSVSWIFHGDPGLALTFVTIGSSVGQCVLPYFTEIFIEQYRLNGAFLLLGGLALQCVPCGYYIYTSKDFYKTDFDESDMNFTDNIKKICDSSLLRDVTVVLVLFNTFLLAFTGNTEVFFFVDILSSRGFARSKGSLLLTVLGFGSLAGRLLGFLIRFKIKIKTVWHWVYLWPIVSVGHVLAITIYDYDQLTAVCMLYGVAFGTIFAMVQTIAFEVCGLVRYPQGAALVNLMLGLGSFCSTLFGGMIKDETGVYDPVFYVAAGSGIYISVTSAVVAILLRKRDVTQNATESKHRVDSQYKQL